jgi:hypothetical protein
MIWDILNTKFADFYDFWCLFIGGRSVFLWWDIVVAVAS